jgi:hypothetical protein
MIGKKPTRDMVFGGSSPGGKIVEVAESKASLKLSGLFHMPMEDTYRGKTVSQR